MKGEKIINKFRDVIFGDVNDYRDVVAFALVLCNGEEETGQKTFPDGDCLRRAGSHRDVHPIAQIHQLLPHLTGVRQIAKVDEIIKAPALKRYQFKIDKTEWAVLRVLSLP